MTEGYHSALSGWALEELKFASFTRPFCVGQRLQLGTHIIPWRERFAGHHDHHLLQHPSPLRDKLEESNLASRPSELVQEHLLHALHDTFDGTAILPELGIELGIDLSGGLFRYAVRLQMKLISAYIVQGSYL